MVLNVCILNNFDNTIFTVWHMVKLQLSVRLCHCKNRNVIWQIACYFFSRYKCVTAGYCTKNTLVLNDQFHCTWCAFYAIIVLTNLLFNKQTDIVFLQCMTNQVPKLLTISDQYLLPHNISIIYYQCITINFIYFYWDSSSGHKPSFLKIYVLIILHN